MQIAKPFDTENKRTEGGEWFKTLTEVALTSIIIIEGDKFLYANRYTETLMGFSPTELINMNFWDVVHPEFREMVKQRGLARQRGEEVPTAYEFKILTKSKEEKWVQTSAALTDFEGRKCTLAIVFDITEKKKSEEALKRSLNEKEILLKEIHHRVKNNLQIVTSLLKLQSSYVGDENIKKLFKESQNRVHSMALIHQKLYQTKDLSHIDFGEYTETVVKYLQHSYGILQDKVMIKIDVQNSVMSIDNAIPAGLIINELVSNSLKHAFPEDRKGNIFINIAYDTFNKEYWLVIRDDGIGIQKDFDVKSSTSFGLKLVSTLVDQMSGKIELVSKGGCEYRITFKSADYPDRN